jgi:hypothetical protein
MGGNIKYAGQQVDKIDIRKINQLEFIKDVHEMLIEIKFQACDFTAKFGGSSKYLMNWLMPKEELIAYKPQFGDLDILVNKENRKKITEYLHKNPKNGKFYFLQLGLNHGAQTSWIVSYDKYVFQLDFVWVDNLEEDEFLHSSDWEDIKIGISGAMHKILLNSINSKYKFSIIYGLGNREGEPKWTKDKDTMVKLLYAPLPEDGSHRGLIDSFQGVVSMAKYHFTREQLVDAFNKFCKDSEKLDNIYAIELLKTIFDL